MIGGLGEPNAGIYGADLTRRMAQSFNGRPFILSSPGIVKSKSLCDALKSDHQIEETLKLAATADIALMGIGSFRDSSRIFSTDIILTVKDRELLTQAGAVGDISLQFFNSNGDFIKSPLNDRIVGLTLEQVLKIQRRIGIAGGKSKMEAIMAALKGKMVNYLITDEANARNLLNN